MSRTRSEDLVRRFGFERVPGDWEQMTHDPRSGRKHYRKSYLGHRVDIILLSGKGAPWLLCVCVGTFAKYYQDITHSQLKNRLSNIPALMVALRLKGPK